MFTATVEGQFSAAHQVRLPDGSLEPIHGHDWHVTATFASQQLDPTGFVVDFVAARAALDDVLSGLHHQHLNHAPALAGINPTAEHLARYLFERLAASAVGTCLLAIRITEAPGCAATYQP